MTDREAQPARPRRPPVHVVVELVGEETRTVTAPADGTYGELLEPFEVTRHEVTVLVDGRPVPADQHLTADVDHVRVVRLVRGG